MNKESPAYARLAMLGNTESSPTETAVAEAAVAIRSELYFAAARIVVQIEQHPHDIGRMLHALDLINQARSVACESLLLPTYKK